MRNSGPTACRAETAHRTPHPVDDDANSPQHRPNHVRIARNSPVRARAPQPRPELRRAGSGE
ncbi:hypothetical protein [Streptomyces sp. NPDC005251]|uniref:hypothetical protein n=1 Tax=unclassified Streptomyces TaxID=2593676 RepID=UPI0033B71356